MAEWPLPARQFRGIDIAVCGSVTRIWELPSCSERVRRVRAITIWDYADQSGVDDEGVGRARLDAWRRAANSVSAQVLPAAESRRPDLLKDPLPDTESGACEGDSSS